jgi:hypothetical protein
MTLDEQLRAALSQEADMQTVPRPDIDELISGGRELRHRRTRTRFGVAAAVAVLVAGGTSVVTLDDPVTKGEPAQTSGQSQSAAPQPPPLGDSDPEPDGTYRMLVGVGATSETIEADLTFDGAGWSGGNYPVVRRGAASGGVGVYQPLALAAGSGCDEADYDVATTAPALAEQLSKLPRSTVVQAATPQQAFGRDALHLRVRIDAQCPPDSGYSVAEGPRGSQGLNFSSYYNEVIVDFWVVDVDGAPVVVSAWHHDVASSALVDQIDRTRASVTFTTDQ